MTVDCKALCLAATGAPAEGGSRFAPRTHAARGCPGAARHKTAAGRGQIAFAAADHESPGLAPSFEGPVQSASKTDLVTVHQPLAGNAFTVDEGPILWV